MKTFLENIKAKSVLKISLEFSLYKKYKTFFVLPEYREPCLSIEQSTIQEDQE